MDFVKKHKLQRIIGDGWSDQELERHLRPQAETATQSPVKLGRISPELVMHLAVMSLYDLAVLIGRFLVVTPYFNILNLKTKLIL